MMNATRLLIFFGALLAAACSGACGSPVPDIEGTSTESSTVDTEPADTEPTPDGPARVVADMTVPGLESSVAAVYDEHGLLHLRCSTDEDCVAALGYFHAANRFFLMDFMRRLYRGQLGEIVELGGGLGETILELDAANRHFLSTRDGEPLEDVMVEQLTDAQRALLDRYAAGVNAWLADARLGRNGAALPREFNIPLLYQGADANKAEAMRDWEPADSMAVMLALLDEQSNSTEEELAVGVSFPSLAEVDPGLAEEIHSLRPDFAVDSHTVAGARWRGADGAFSLDTAGITQRLGAARTSIAQANSSTGFGNGDGGSNNWAVSGEHTVSGRPLLAGDPHLALSNPALFFPVEIDSRTGIDATGSIHAAGVSFAGLPAIIAGHNEHLAWTVTTAHYDIADVYVEELTADGTAVRFMGEEVPLLRRDVTFSSNGEPTTVPLEWVPHHGPVIAKDIESGTAVSVRWSLHDGFAGRDIFAMYDLMSASNVEEGGEALSNMTSSNLNFVLVDDQDDLAWFAYVQMPNRPWDWQTAPPWMPLPGDGSAEWDGYLPLEELPQLENPPSGFLSTANQDLTGAYADGNPADAAGIAQDYHTDGGARLARIYDLLRAGAGKHTVDTMLEIQSDTYSKYGEALVPTLVGDLERGSRTQTESDAYTALANWRYECPTGLEGIDPAGPVDSDPRKVEESIGCAVFHVFLYELAAAAFDDEATEAGANMTFADRLGVILRSIATPNDMVSLSQATFWDDRTTPALERREQIVAKAFSAAVQRLARPIDPRGGEAGLGPDVAQWQWGRMHTVTFRSPFSLVSDALSGFNEGPYANDGGLGTIDVANPQDGKDLDYSHLSGAASRMVIAFGDGGPTMYFQLPGGTSTLREPAERYNQLAERWLRNEPVVFPWGSGAIMAPQEALLVAPAPAAP